MFDEHTLVVTYRDWRGEPRGKHKAGQSWDGRGDCIDCRQCVAVCPTGIDIRDGQQMECIGCALCIDACDDVMAKVGRPPRLIAFDTFADQSARAAGGTPVFRLVRPRVLVYAGLLLLVGAIMLGAFVSRSELEVNVLRDRTPLYVTLADGAIRNGYTLKILNKSREERAYRLTFSELAGGTVSVLGVSEQADSNAPLLLRAEPDSVATFRVYVAAPRRALRGESTPLVFTVQRPGRRRRRRVPRGIPRAGEIGWPTILRFLVGPRAGSPLSSWAACLRSSPSTRP